MFSVKLAACGTGLGVGICALIIGASKIVMFDEFNHLNYANIMDEFDYLTKLFLKNDKFKHFVMNNEQMRFLKSQLELFIRNGESDIIKYYVPFIQNKYISEQKIDYLISTATFEHVEPISLGYKNVASLVDENGWLSLSIDLRSHGFTDLEPDGSRSYNGHLKFNNEEWAKKAEIDKRTYTINRITATEHLQIISKDFDIKFFLKRRESQSINRVDLAPMYKWLPEDELNCSGLHVVAVKL